MRTFIVGISYKLCCKFAKTKTISMFMMFKAFDRAALVVKGEICGNGSFKWFFKDTTKERREIQLFRWYPALWFIETPKPPLCKPNRSRVARARVPSSGRSTHDPAHARSLIIAGNPSNTQRGERVDAHTESRVAANRSSSGSGRRGRSRRNRIARVCTTREIHREEREETGPTQPSGSVRKSLLATLYAL